MSNHYRNSNIHEIDVGARIKSGLWGHIIAIPEISHGIFEMISRGLWRKVGKGNATLFWEHCWIGDKELKEAFSQLYNISNQLKSLIIDMGFWDGRMWRWSFSWRRDFFQWEEQLFERFITILEQHSLKQDIEDAFSWRFDPSGSFSSKFFCSTIECFIAANSIGTFYASITVLE